MKTNHLNKVAILFAIIFSLISCSSDDEATDTVNNTSSVYGFNVNNFEGTNLEFKDNTSHYFVFSAMPGRHALTSVVKFSNAITRIDDCTTNSYVYSGPQTTEDQILTISFSGLYTTFLNNDISSTFDAIYGNLPSNPLLPNDKVFQVVLAYKNSNNAAVIKYNLPGSQLKLDKINNFEYKISGTILFGNNLSIQIPVGTIADFDCIAPAPVQPLEVTSANLLGKWQEELYRVSSYDDFNYLNSFFVTCPTTPIPNPNIYWEFSGTTLKRSEQFDKMKIEKIVTSLSNLTSLSATSTHNKAFIFGSDIYVWYNVTGKNINSISDWVKIIPSNNEDFVVNSSSPGFSSGTYKFVSSTFVFQSGNTFINNCTTTKVYNSSYTLNGSLLNIINPVLSTNPSIFLPSYRSSIPLTSNIIYLDANTMRIKHTISGVNYIISYKRI
jgi:hypothetical protein